MPRFELEIEGENLSRAQAALNGAGIPTISAGTPAEEPSRKPGRGRRFFRSGAFWILIVILIAFFSQRLIADPDENGPTYDQFLSQVEREPSTIERVTLDPGDTTVEVVQRNGEGYETGNPPRSEESLVNALRRQGIETEVEDTGGSSILSWLVYLLPFLLFFAFWLFLMNRMRSDGPGTGVAAEGTQPDSLKAVLDVESPEEAEASVRRSLPGDGNYRVGRVKRW